MREGQRAPGARAAGPVVARGASPRWLVAASVACAVAAGMAVGFEVGSTLVPVVFAADSDDVGSDAPRPTGVGASPARNEATARPILVTTAAGRAAGDDASAVSSALPVASAEWEADARALYGRAVDLAAKDPEAAVVAYARAALRGHARSARYLGQIYEIGDGVPARPDLARAWYDLAEAGPEAAQRDVPGGTSVPEGSTGAPVPTFSARMPDGLVELVWTGAGGGLGYRVEFARDPLAKPVGSLDAAVSAVFGDRSRGCRVLAGGRRRRGARGRLDAHRFAHRAVAFGRQQPTMSQICWR